MHALECLESEDLDYFGLTNDPFDTPADPEEVFLSPELQRVEKKLRDTIVRKRILALVAPSGAGKSTLIRRLSGRIRGESHVRLIAPASLDRTRISHAALGVAILRDLVLKDTTGLTMEARSELLRATLEEQTAMGNYPVLLIDEAHLLKTQALLAIKQLWDSHTLHQQLAVVLVGQPAFKGRLQQEPAVRELLGRTQIAEIPALGERTGDYLRWRFARVGGNADQVFEAPAYKVLATRGEQPMWVNTLAVLAMKYARTLGDRKVTATHVGRV